MKLDRNRKKNLILENSPPPKKKQQRIVKTKFSTIQRASSLWATF